MSKVDYFCKQARNNNNYGENRMVVVAWLLYLTSLLSFKTIALNDIQANYNSLKLNCDQLDPHFNSL